MLRVRTALALVTLLVVSCGSPADESSETTTTTSLAVTSSIQPTTTMGDNAPTETDMPSESEMIDSAVEDLSRRLLTTEDNIEVVETRRVVWPDGSLGCPEEGMTYTQATIDGFQVLLGSDDKVYDYHAGDDGEVFLCPSDERDGGYDFVPPPGFND